VVMATFNNKEKADFEVVNKKPYHEQGQFVLNAYWGELESKAEQIWCHHQKLKELDKQQWSALMAAGKAQGDYTENTSLDEFWSHKFLENIGKTMSIVEFRKEFQKIDANTDKRMGFVEFLIWEYKLDVHELLSRPQGGDPAELKKAQDLLDEVSTAFKTAQTALDQASKTEAEAKKRKDAAVLSDKEAKKKAAESKTKAETARVAAEKSEVSAAAAKTAADEQRAALDVLKKEEQTFNDKKAELQAKSETSGVAGMTAKNQLAQLLSEDPLPLRKAKITAEAAAKKTEKANKEAQAAKEKAQLEYESSEAARIAAEEAERQAEADRISAESAAAQAESDRIAAEESLRESEQKLAEAEAFLAEVKKKSTKTHGTFWWLERELAERKKYMPKSGKAKLLF